MPYNILVLTWLFLLTGLPFLFAIINIRHFIQFWSLRHYQYINSRKPKLLMIYTVLVSISLFIITPITCLSIYAQSLHVHQMPKEIIHIRNKRWFTCFLIFDSIHGSILCTLITIIAVRIWLLFYDHKFAIATVDRVWRKTINPSDHNFFLNFRKTLGNDEYLLKFVFTIWITIICVIVSIIVMFRESSLAYFFVLRVFLSIPVAIFIFTICYKIKSINDEFHLRREMQYLGRLVLFIIMTSITASILVYSGTFTLYIFEAVVHSFDILFIICSSYIQTKSVLNLLMKNLNKIKHQNVSNSRSKVTMLDILRNQHPFETFMRHCVNELSVESLLFLVEVAQYKSTLCQYNAPDALSQYSCLNVQKANLRHILLASRYEQRMSIATEPYAMIESDGRIPNMIEHMHSNSTGRSSSMRSTSINMAKKESKFQQFQESILERKWLPVSFIVPARKRSTESLSLIPQTQIASKSMRNLRVLGANAEDSTETECLKLEGGSGMSSNKRSSDENISAESIKINIGDTINTPSATPKTPDDSPSLSPRQNGKVAVARFNFKDIPILKATNSQRTPKTPKTPNCTVSAEWIKDFAMFLFEKYIEDNAELSVNISGWTRKFLTYLFRIKDDERFFEFIVQHSGGEMDRSACLSAAINQQTLINTYLYHIFDESFDEIWSLLRQNAFMRFTLTDGYKRLLKTKENGARLSGIMIDPFRRNSTVTTTASGRSRTISQ